MLIKDLIILKDSVGQPYLGCKFTYDEVQEYLLKLANLEPDMFNKLVDNRRKRDGKDFHMTVFSVAEYNKVGKPTIQELEDSYKLVHFDITLKGLGRAVKDNPISVAYFVICTSNMANSLRRGFGLSEKHFHITLGFDPKDVHGVIKNESVMI